MVVPLRARWRSNALMLVEALLPEPGAARPGRKLLVRQELRMHPHHEHLLVVGSVEDADAAPCRHPAGHAPEEVVVEILGRRLLERGDLAPLRVDPGHDVLDGAVLAGGVEGLEDHEQRPGVAGPQELLLPGDLGPGLLEVLLGPLLGVLSVQVRELLAAFPARVALGQVGRAARLDHQPVQDGAGDRHGLLPECGWIGGWVGGFFLRPAAEVEPGCQGEQEVHHDEDRAQGLIIGRCPRSDRVAPWCAYGRRGVFRVAQSGPAGLRPGDLGGRAGGGRAAVVAGRAGV